MEHIIMTFGWSGVTLICFFVALIGALIVRWAAKTQQKYMENPDKPKISDRISQFETKEKSDD